jgi:hypothetical protein
MKRNRWLAACTAALFLIVLGGMAVAAEKTTSAQKSPAVDKVKLAGTVVAVKDAKGKVTGATLKTDKDEYRIIGKKAKDLQKLVDKKVEVTGLVKEPKDPKAKKSVNVSEFKELGK